MAGIAFNAWMGVTVIPSGLASPGHPQFPGPSPLTGIQFWDITTLLLQPAIFQDCINMFVERYRGFDIQLVAGKRHACSRGREGQVGAVTQLAPRSLPPEIASRLPLTKLAISLAYPPPPPFRVACRL